MENGKRVLYCAYRMAQSIDITMGKVDFDTANTNVAGCILAFTSLEALQDHYGADCPYFQMTVGEQEVADEEQ